MRTRRLCMLVVVAALLVGAAPAAHEAPAAHDRVPLRSGTILGGYFPFAGVAPGPGPNCHSNVDCLPWAEAGCPAELTGIDPAVHSSIVDVSRLVKRRPLEFRVRPLLTSRFVWGGVAVQFWSAGCTHLTSYGTSWTYGYGIRSRARFPIPRGAKWMTVASVDSTALEWQLSRP